MNKNAIIAGGYRLLKVDTLDNRSISDDILLNLAKADRHAQRPTRSSFSDFRHGIFNRRTIPTLIDAIPDGMYTVADSQVASRWGNITDFQGFDLITPNEREARFALGDQDSGVRPLASSLYDAAACKTADPQARRARRAHLPPRRPPGARLASSSSTASSTAGRRASAPATRCSPTRRCAMLASKCDVIATILGSMAAACECEKDGNIPITLEDVHAQARRGRARGEVRLAPPCASSSSASASKVTSAGASPAPTLSPRSTPVNPEADFRRSARGSARRATTRRWLCIPDAPKIGLLGYLRRQRQARARRKAAVGGATRRRSRELQQDARAKGVVCYTAYNHRFEPHFVRMRDLIASGELGRIYRCRMFYGNGTARLVRNSDWRDQRRRRARRSRLAPARYVRASGSATSAMRSRSYRPTASRTAPRSRRVRERPARARGSNSK